MFLEVMIGHPPDHQTDRTQPPPSTQKRIDNQYHALVGINGFEGNALSEKSKLLSCPPNSLRNTFFQSFLVQKIGIFRLGTLYSLNSFLLAQHGFYI